MLFVLMAGLRYRIGGDTFNYMYDFYYRIPELSNLTLTYFEESSMEPLFVLFNSIIKTLFGKFYVFLLCHALFVNSLIFIYIKKHSPYPFLCVLFYFVWIYTFYNFETLRASMAIAICLFANDYAFDRKWIKAVLLYAVAALFHTSSLLLLVSFLFVFLRLNYLSYAVLALSFIVGAIIQESFSEYLLLFGGDDVYTDKLSGYVNDEKNFNTTMGIGGILITKIPYIFYVVASAYFYNKVQSRKSSLKRLEPFVIMGLVFVIMSIYMSIMYRYIHFYVIYFAIYFSYLFVEIIKMDILKSKLVSLGFAAFIFAPLFNIVIIHGYFDTLKESTNTRKYYPYQKYYPYASILDMETDDDREKLYVAVGGTDSKRFIGWY